MPLTVMDPVVTTDKLPSMVAWYRLQTSSIAVDLVQRNMFFDSYRTGTWYIPFMALL